MNFNPQLEIAVVGAGLAGLTCARQLHEQGHSVALFEKARGSGGRATTRRLQGGCVDRGLPDLEAQGEFTGHLIARGQQAQLLRVWGDEFYTFKASELVKQPQRPRYVASEGISAIAKLLADGLTLYPNHRLESLTPTPQGTWHLAFEGIAQPQAAKAVILAIPAPQALPLIEPFAPDFLPALQAVEFDPCMSVAAGYDAAFAAQKSWQAVQFEGDSDLSWAIDDSSKRSPTPPQKIFVFHSTPSYARGVLDAADLNLAAAPLLDRAAQLLRVEFQNPDWAMAHRWRYARVRRPLSEPALVSAHPLPLACCGDWCSGDRAEDALRSGAAAADEILRFFK